MKRDAETRYASLASRIPPLPWQINHRSASPLGQVPDSLAKGKEGGCKLRAVYQQAELHCANFCRGGICTGVDFDKTGRPIRWQTAGSRCLLALGQRCRYFEEAVLPMAKRDLWPAPLQGAAFREAAQLYHLTFPETVVTEPATRKCPDCGKGLVERRKRYCTECRKRHRRATNALVNRNWRKTAPQRDAVKENSSLILNDLHKQFWKA